MTDDPLKHVLDALSGGKEEWVSSSSLTSKLDVSRMAVFKHVQRLRALGYAIEASPRLGYRMTARTDRPIEQEVVPRLHTQVVGSEYQYVDSIASTNNFLRRHHENFLDGATLVADRQTAGRGRLHRQWHSPAGTNLYFSVLLRPAVTPALAPQLSLVVASAVLASVHEEGCADAVVKWPNDILWQGRKLVGILCELEAETDAIHAVVLGVGMNVNMTRFPGAIRDTAGSLRQAVGHAVSRPVLLARILNRLDTAYAQWLREGLEPAAEFLNSHSALAGRDVYVERPTDTVQGCVDRITGEGHLRLRTPDGRVAEVASGEVQLCRPTEHA
jgi:BirA family biotin operon repressor/biotin-[acetyl-CoA-carboxylase] ligase